MSPRAPASIRIERPVPPLPRRASPALDDVCFAVAPGARLGPAGAQRGGQDHPHADPVRLPPGSTPRGQAPAPRRGGRISTCARLAGGAHAGRLPARAGAALPRAAGARAPRVPGPDQARAPRVAAGRGAPGRRADRDRDHARGADRPAQRGAIVSGSGWPMPCSARPRCSCSTSRPSASTPIRSCEIRAMLRGLGGAQTLVFSLAHPGRGRGPVRSGGDPRRRRGGGRRTAGAMRWPPATSTVRWASDGELARAVVAAAAHASSARAARRSRFVDDDDEVAVRIERRRGGRRRRRCCGALGRAAPRHGPRWSSLAPGRTRLEERFAEVTGVAGGGRWLSPRSRGGRWLVAGVGSVAFRELLSLFVTPLAYVVGTLFLFLQGWNFALLLRVLNDPLAAPGPVMQYYFGGSFFIFWLPVVVPSAPRSRCGWSPRSAARAPSRPCSPHRFRPGQVVLGQVPRGARLLRRCCGCRPAVFYLLLRGAQVAARSPARSPRATSVPCWWARASSRSACSRAPCRVRSSRPRSRPWSRAPWMLAGLLVAQVDSPAPRRAARAHQPAGDDAGARPGDRRRSLAVDPCRGGGHDARGGDVAAGRSAALGRARGPGRAGGVVAVHLAWFGVAARRARRLDRRSRVQRSARSGGGGARRARSARRRPGVVPSTIGGGRPIPWPGSCARSCGRMTDASEALRMTVLDPDRDRQEAEQLLARVRARRARPRRRRGAGAGGAGANSGVPTCCRTIW